MWFVAFQQGGQFAFLVSPADPHPGARRAGEHILGMAQKLDFEAGGVGRHGHRGHGMGALVVGQHAQYGDPQFLARPGRRPHPPRPRLHRLMTQHPRLHAQTMAGQAVQRVLAGGEDAVGLAELPGPAVPPGQDIGRPVRGPVGYAGVAPLRSRFAAIRTGRPGEEGDLGAECEIVVDGHVERHVQRMDQRAGVDLVSHQVMDMDPGDIGGSRHRRQVAPAFRRQDQAGMPGQRGHRQRGAGGGGLQHQVVHAAPVALDGVQDVPPHAAAQLVRQQQDRGQAGVAEQRHGDRETVRRVFRLLHMPHDQRLIRGIPRGQQLVGVRRQTPGAGAETDIALVPDIRVAGDMMRPAESGGTAAEIVLLAIAEAEGSGIEQPRLVQGRAPDVHAIPDGGGRGHEAPGVDRPADSVDARQGHAVRNRPALVIRVTTDGGVVRQRRHAPHPRPRIRLGAQAGQPARGHLGIAVQQGDVVIPRLRHAAVDRGDEAEILLVAQQPDRALFRQPGQVRADLGLGRAVVDDDDPARRAVRVGQHRFQAAPRGRQPAIHRHHHIHRDRSGQGEHGGEQGGRRDGGQVILDQQRAFRGPAARGADAQMEQHRIARGFRVLCHIPGGVEAGMRVMAARRALDQIMQQGMRVRRRRVGVLAHIPGAVEPCVGIALLVHPVVDKMP